MKTIRLAGQSLATVALMLAYITAPVFGSPILGLRAIEDELPYQMDDQRPVQLLLSKSKYPAEDQHLDAIAWLKAEVGLRGGTLEVTIEDAEGKTALRERIAPIPGRQLFFSPMMPESLIGGEGLLRLRWRGANGRLIGEASARFSVLAKQELSQTGRIAITIPNDVAAVQRGVPMTVGVPFPRGVLLDETHLRLLDEQGRMIPLQTRVTSRWSRFGSIRWVQCDFIADVAGGPRKLFLEFGPDVSRTSDQPVRVTQREGQPPLIDLGPLRFGDGIAFDAGDGRGFRQALSPESLHGAFVEHENGKRFVMPASTPFEVEEQGEEKVVLRRRGWYVEPASGERFCQFDTRYVLHRGSPLVRIFHTWIYTGYPYEQLYEWTSARAIRVHEGEGHADRIRDMGWRFGHAEALKPRGFLSSFEPGAVWYQADYLLQHDYDKYEAVGSATVTGERAAGVASLAGDGGRLVLGVKDFWQNFPNELEFADGALFFHQWPRHGKPAGSHPPQVEQGLRLWFAHEGKLLDFAIPQAYTDDPAFQEANPINYHLQGFRQTMNAQGIAKTDEMWLLFGEDATPAGDLSRVFAGLNDGTLRAIVDPTWIAASGVFYEMHPKDVEKYPEDERVYELHALAPLTWIEQLRFYGKWIWGDMWWGARLRERDWGQVHGVYRGFRKSHQGWPYSWIPFARSGDPRLARLADAATRHMTDAVFSSYSDERVPPWKAGIEGNPIRPRWRGFHIRFHIPWAGPRYDPTSRDYTDKCNYLWHSYYLTGYPRARDVALDWAELCKNEGAARWHSRGDAQTIFTGSAETDDATRMSVTLLQSFVEQYQATFDPWFLAAAHQAARLQLTWFREEDSKGHFWNPGPREFHRFTGNDEYAEFYLAYARDQAHVHEQTAHANWAWLCSNIEPAAYAFHLTGDEFFLERADFWLDYTRIATYDGKPDYYRGTIIRNAAVNTAPTYTGYYLQHFPYALAAFERAGRRPQSVPGTFRYCPEAPKVQDRDLYAYRYRIALSKQSNQAIPLQLNIQQTLWTPDPQFKEEFHYRVESANGDVLSYGTWDVKDPTTLEIPAEAPTGVYRLHIEGDSQFRPTGSWRQIPSLSLPVSPPGTPEVIELEAGANIGRSHPTSQYWFEAPQGIEEFWVEFPVPAIRKDDCDLVRFSIWDSQGRRVWDEQFSIADRPKASSVRAVVRVPEDQAGRLWRITVAGLSESIALDPAIARIFAVSRDRWFQP